MQDWHLSVLVRLSFFIRTFGRLYGIVSRFNFIPFLLFKYNKI